MLLNIETLLKNKNVNVVEISKRLGHRDMSTTLNIYEHTDLIQEKRVQRTLNSIRFNPFQKIKSFIKR